jgi:hypothetical protein
LEYLLGTSDTDSGSLPEPLQASFDGRGYFAVVLHRDAAADGAGLMVESSEDLVNWAPAALLDSHLVSGGRLEESWGVPAEARRASFLRLRAELR